MIPYILLPCLNHQNAQLQQYSYSFFLDPNSLPSQNPKSSKISYKFESTYIAEAQV